MLLLVVVVVVVVVVVLLLSSFLSTACGHKIRGLDVRLYVRMYLLYFPLFAEKRRFGGRRGGVQISLFFQAGDRWTVTQHRYNQEYDALKHYTPIDEHTV